MENENGSNDNGAEQQNNVPETSTPATPVESNAPVASEPAAEPASEEGKPEVEGEAPAAEQSEPQATVETTTEPAPTSGAVETASPAMFGRFNEEKVIESMQKAGLKVKPYTQSTQKHKDI